MHPLTRTKIPLYVQVKDHSRAEVATFDPEKKSWLYISKNLVFTDDEDIKNDVYLAHLFMKKNSSDSLNIQSFMCQLLPEM